MLFSSQTAGSVHAYGIYEGTKKMLDAGFPALDWSIFKDYEYMFAPDWKDTAKRLRDMVEERGAIFNQSQAPFYFSYNLDNPEMIPTLSRAIEFAAQLGAKSIVVHPLQEGTYFGNEEHLFELNMKFYSLLAPVARDSGIKVAIENTFQRRQPTNIIYDDVCSNPFEHARYFDALKDQEAFTLCLDVGHAALCGRMPQEVIPILGKERLGAVHMHDVDYVNDLHLCPGASKLDWNAICKALADIDYDGVFTMEPEGFYTGFGKEFLPQVLHFMAQVGEHLANKVEAYRLENQSK